VYTSWSLCVGACVRVDAVGVWCACVYVRISAGYRPELTGPSVPRPGILRKYSNFVGFPLVLNGERLNTIQPLWTLTKGRITEEQHNGARTGCTHACLSLCLYACLCIAYLSPSLFMWVSVWTCVNAVQY
jgi:hypothetical protein